MAGTPANRKAVEAPLPILGRTISMATSACRQRGTRVERRSGQPHRAVIADRKLTQAKAGEIMGLPQPKVSEFVSGAPPASARNVSSGF